METAQFLDRPSTLSKEDILDQAEFKLETLTAWLKYFGSEDGEMTTALLNRIREQVEEALNLLIELH